MENFLVNIFREIYPACPEILSSAPGRINLIGEHTDYNLGLVLPAAIHLRNYFLANKINRNEVCIYTENLKEKESFALNKISSSRDKRWVNYVKGIFWVLKKEGIVLSGINAFLFSDIPLEAGLSSSAALEISILVGLNSLFRLGLSKERIAELAQKAENDFVGVRCGLMDQYISLFAKKSHALFLDCETLESELIPLRLNKEALCILVYESGVRRDLASSAYNQRRRESSAAFEFLRKQGMESYKAITSEMLEEQKGKMDEVLYKRAWHVVSENQRVRRAVEALKRDQFGLVGSLIFQSHQSLRNDYQVSCPELDLLYEVGKEFPGCLGARLTGAGFGGAGIALVKEERKETFIEELLRQARKRGFPRPCFHDVEVGEGAKVHLKILNPMLT